MYNHYHNVLTLNSINSIVPFTWTLAGAMHCSEELCIDGWLNYTT